MADTMMKLWAPVTKDANGDFVAILSDTSMDRDGEFMSKELLNDWASNNTLKALANHDNSMQSWVGGWTDLRTVSKGDNTALVGKPWFFSKDANPLAHQVKLQAEEALSKGENPGISIGAIPVKSIQKDIDGTQHTVYTKAELLEATWVPIQSNRNATFGHIAKKFSLDITKSLEDNKMTEEQIKKQEESSEEVAPSPAPEAEAAPAAPVEEAKEEVSSEEKKEASKLVELEKALKATQKELAEMKTKAVLSATVEGPSAHKEAVEKATEVEPTFLGLMKMKYGGIN